jgi:large subunit ribosomal protein L10
MAISKEKKGEIVDKLSNALKSAKSLVFVNFKGLSVANTTEMRQALKNEGVGYTVAKKTLTNRALDAEKFEGEKPSLDGELALAWGLPEQAGKDPLAPIAQVYTFQKKYPENIKILGGVFQGRYVGVGEVNELALIPPMPVLRGKFVNIINSPIQRVAVALSEIAKLKA